jgi:hypothetical protein
MLTLNRILTAFGNFTYIVSSLAGFFIMVSLGIRGLWEIIKGLRIRESWASTAGGTASSSEYAIVGALQGFEFLLLAPLALVIIVSIGRYLTALVPAHDNVAQDEHQKAEHQLHRVKILIISLMISIVATDLVKRFVAQPEVSIRALAYGGSLILLLLIYLAVMSQIARRQ